MEYNLARLSYIVYITRYARYLCHQIEIRHDFIRKECWRNWYQSTYEPRSMRSSIVLKNNQFFICLDMSLNISIRKDLMAMTSFSMKIYLIWIIVWYQSKHYILIRFYLYFHICFLRIVLIKNSVVYIHSVEDIPPQVDCTVQARHVTECLVLQYIP